MIDNKTRMIELLKNANRAMSRRFPDMKKSQHEIREFLNSCVRPKKEFNDLYNIVKYGSFEDAQLAYTKFTQNVNVNIMPTKSDEYVDANNMNDLKVIMVRRQENANKSVSEIFAEMENAYYNVTRECISKDIQNDLCEFKSFITRKNFIDMITIGKYILNRIVTGRDHYISADISIKLNSLMFYITMLEDKSCEYIKRYH